MKLRLQILLILFILPLTYLSAMEEREPMSETERQEIGSALMKALNLGRYTGQETDEKLWQEVEDITERGTRDQKLIEWAVQQQLRSLRTLQGFFNFQRLTNNLIIPQTLYLYEAIFLKQYPMTKQLINIFGKRILSKTPTDVLNFARRYGDLETTNFLKSIIPLDQRGGTSLRQRIKQFAGQNIQNINQQLWNQVKAMEESEGAYSIYKPRGYIPLVLREEDFGIGMTEDLLGLWFDKEGLRNFTRFLYPYETFNDQSPLLPFYLSQAILNQDPDAVEEYLTHFKLTDINPNVINKLKQDNAGTPEIWQMINEAVSKSGVEKMEIEESTGVEKMETD